MRIIATLCTLFLLAPMVVAFKQMKPRIFPRPVKVLHLAPEATFELTNQAFNSIPIVTFAVVLFFQDKNLKDRLAMDWEHFDEVQALREKAIKQEIDQLEKVWEIRFEFMKNITLKNETAI